MKSPFTSVQCAFLGLVTMLFVSSCSTKSDVDAIAPTSAFAYTSVRNFPVMVHFTNTSPDIGTTGYSFNWVFGDGGQSTLQSPVHAYTSSGAYTVELHESAPGSSGTLFQVIDLSTATPSGSSGRLSPTDFIYTVDQSYTVTFTDQSQNAATRHWTFGDGTEATNPGTSFTHVFSGAGPFVVQLTATGTGASDNSSAQISF